MVEGLLVGVCVFLVVVAVRYRVQVDKPAVQVRPPVDPGPSPEWRRQQLRAITKERDR